MNPNEPVKIPGPDHPITIHPEAAFVHVLFGGHALADSREVLVLREADLPAVRYFPRDDVAMAFLRPNPDHTTYCPYKGRASYFTLYRDGQIIENAAWSYETPHPAMAQIAGRIAFYPQNVEFIAEPLAAGERAQIDEAVLHTDSGSGASQQEAWAPTTQPHQNRDAPDAPPYRGVGSI